MAEFIMPDEDTIPNDNPQIKLPMEKSMAGFTWSNGDSMHGDDPYINRRAQAETPMEVPWAIS